MSAGDAIHSDDAWKQEAQREKERLAGAGQQPSEPPAQAAAGHPAPAESPQAAEPAREPPQRKARRVELPAASFALVVEQYVTQALLYMGVMPHPGTGKSEKDLDVARHMIDTLALLQEKTKGNLTAEEERGLTSALYELRMLYVKSSK